MPRWILAIAILFGTALLFGCSTAGNSSASSGLVPRIATSSLPIATVNQSYSATLQATGGTAPYSWAVVSGSLPAGVSLSTDGQIAGTPTQTGSFIFTAQVQDSNKHSSSSGLHFKASGPGPAISAISPSNGSTAGGTAVTISGNNLQSGAAVTFGGAAGTSVSVTSSTQMTALTPAHAAGLVDVVVTNPNGKSFILAAGFGYGSAAPVVSGVSPNSGPTSGGTTVKITGSNFATGALVFFGAVAASGVSIGGPTQIQATAPSVSTAAAVSVVVQNADGQSGSLANGFTYTSAPSNSSPTVSAVSPSTVSPGSAVTIDGTSFASGATVTVGSTAASSVQFLSSTQLAATVPSVSPGTYDVTVANTNGLSATLSSALTVASPSSSDLLSGCTVTASGTVGSSSNSSPAISCATPSGWTVVSAENFSSGVLHASDKTALGGSGAIQCTTFHSAGSCALRVTVTGDGCSYCTWILNGNVVPSGATAVYLSFWQYEPGAVEGLWGAPNFILANIAGGGQAELMDRWSGVTCNGQGPGSDYYCTHTRAVFSPGSNTAGGANAAYYGASYDLGSGSWVQYEIYFQPNTSGSNNGIFKEYRNGVLINSTADGSASGTGNAPTGDLNGTLNMAGMSVAVGGYYLIDKVTDSSGTVCEDPQNPPAGAIWTNSSFANMSPCPTHANFNRYFDDIVVLAR